MYRGVVTGLVPGTTYQLTVAGVNGAARNDGLGVSSDPVSTHTLTGQFEGIEYEMLLIFNFSACILYRISGNFEGIYISRILLIQLH